MERRIEGSGKGGGCSELRAWIVRKPIVENRPEMLGGNAQISLPVWTNSGLKVTGKRHTRNSTSKNETTAMTKDMKQNVVFMFLVWVAVTLVFISQHL
jgi:hypothetical protein